jgi:16S rRNA (guanine966-N2)-methyltransferase
VDPPFNKSYAKKVFEEIKRNNFLGENSIVYLECEKSLDVSFLEDSFTIFKEKSYGEKSYRLLRKII